MKCRAYVSERRYSRPGPCQVKRGIVRGLCRAHRAALEAAKQLFVALEKKRGSHERTA